MRSLFSPIMERYSGVSKPIYSSYIMKKQFPFICNLEKYMILTIGKMGYNTGIGEFYAVLWVLYFFKQLCLSAEIWGI